MTGGSARERQTRNNKSAACSHMFVGLGVKSIFHFMSELSWEHVSLAAMRLQLQENVIRARSVLPCGPSTQFYCFEGNVSTTL